jgi:competence ComEA-like helix-hairpin-helix protein
VVSSGDRWILAVALSVISLCLAVTGVDDLSPFNAMADDPGLEILLDLNSASVEDLDSLPGVGPATARAITQERKRSGGYKAVKELMIVPGIGPATLERLESYLDLKSGKILSGSSR